MRTTALTSLLLILAAGCRGEYAETGDTSVIDTDDTDDTDVTDADGDGVAASDDCNDDDAAIHPGADELCNGIDDDCDDSVDEEATDAATFYVDGDGDGYGDVTSTVQGCDAPTGYVIDATDCDDADAAYHPGAAETECTDPNDYNCDGSVGFADSDADGFAACEDCDDEDAAINADATEVCNAADDDCDGLIDEEGAVGESTWYADADGDTFGDAGTAVVACDQPADHVADATDCDDDDDAVRPDATEVCNDIDDDCDGEADEAGAEGEASFYADGDGDGFGDPATAVVTCFAPADHVDNDQDCDDLEAAVNPDAVETCNSIDDDCDTDTDEPGSLGESTFYLDDDGDGEGDVDKTLLACELPVGYADQWGDCDETNPDINTSATPVCDGVDHDCSGSVDFDFDGDGYSDAWCGGTDCDDDDSSVSPDTGGDCSCESSDDGTGTGPLCPGDSCLDILEAGLSTGDGAYWLVPETQPDADSFQALCDMSSDGGGWTLIADYVSNQGIYDWDPTVHQIQSDSGGATVDEPPLLGADVQGHIAYSWFNPSGQELALECRTDPTDAWHREQSRLFGDWDQGDKGVYGGASWGALGAVDWGRSNHFLCGAVENVGTFRGVSLCSGGGSGGSWANHRASISFNNDSSSYGGGVSMGCDGTGINDGTTGEWAGRVWTRRTPAEELSYFDFDSDDSDVLLGGNSRLESVDGRDAIRFEGEGGGATSAGYAELPNINPTEAITVAAWVKSNDVDSYAGVWQLVSKYSAYILGTHGWESNNVCFIVASPGWVYGSCHAPVDTTLWHHFVGTYDSFTGKKHLYMDGELKDTVMVLPIGALINDDTGPVDLGHRECCDHGGFDGWIDDVHIYDQAISAEEVLALYLVEQ